MIGSMGSKGGKSGKNGNKSEGGGEKKTKTKKKPVMSLAEWNKLSNRTRENVFNGIRPGTQKKKVLTAKQKRDAMRGGN